MDSFDKKYNNKYYNDAYLRANEYKKHYSNFTFLPLIKNTEIILSKNFNNKNVKILDIGCGPGHLANYLEDKGYLDYTGIDFSSQAISMAKKISSYNFYVENIYNTDKFDNNYDVIIGSEVLEHLGSDLEVIKKINKNTFCIFSLPTFGGPGHARSFKSDQEVFDRYGDFFDIVDPIISIGKREKTGLPKWLIFCGKKK